MNELLEPWYPVDEEEKQSLFNEFRKEIHSDHALYNKKIELIGRRCDCDDILFSITGSDDLAIVHLTW